MCPHRLGAPGAGEPYFTKNTANAIFEHLTGPQAGSSEKEPDDNDEDPEDYDM
jgi:hypothetical protein